ncbi:hypothetical protein ACVNPZ_16365 [Staphylococcus aureus]
MDLKLQRGHSSTMDRNTKEARFAPDFIKVWKNVTKKLGQEHQAIKCKY